MRFMQDGASGAGRRVVVQRRLVLTQSGLLERRLATYEVGPTLGDGTCIPSFSVGKRGASPQPNGCVGLSTSQVIGQAMPSAAYPVLDAQQEALAGLEGT